MKFIKSVLDNLIKIPQKVKARRRKDKERMASIQMAVLSRTIRRIK